MKRLFLIVTMLMAVAATLVQAQEEFGEMIPRRTVTSTPQVQPVEGGAPPDVTINGKAASDLTDDELLEFLQSKVQDIYQDEGQVRILRVAPGYPLSIFFREAFQDIIVGDPTMLTITRTTRGLVMTAAARVGDTSMTVVFGGGRRLVYHVFIANSFAEGMTSVRVNYLRTGPSTQRPRSLVNSKGDLNVSYIANVILNYDALRREKAIDEQSIKRFPVFRVSKVTPFTYYDIFRFGDGTIAITFSLRNTADQPARINESKLRVSLGNLEFIPDYTSIEKLRLQPGDSTRGFVVLNQTPFSLNQPFELNWR